MNFDLSILLFMPNDRSYRGMKTLQKHSALSRLRATFKVDKIYRRADLLHLSSAVDRHLAALVKEGFLTKLHQGLYFRPRMTVFGNALADREELVRKFLKDDHFVIYSPSNFNSLGFGTTQLYNVTVVFNRKRSGEHTLGGREFLFRKWREAPKNPTKEFLLVEMVNRLDELAEDRAMVLRNMKKKLSEFNRAKLLFAINHYGHRSTQLKLKEMMSG